MEQINGILEPLFAFFERYPEASGWYTNIIRWVMPLLALASSSMCCALCGK